MPELHVRKTNEVPKQTSLPRAIREQQKVYDDFIQAVSVSDVGELILDPAESARSVKVRIRRAAKRLGAEIQIWDANGNVYFSRAAKRGRRRGRQDGAV